MHLSIVRAKILLTLAVLWAAAATAQTELFFATGVDSTGWAQAQSNADGHVLIESPQYPHGLWLHLADAAGDALAGLRVEYQGRPDSLVAIRCVDPAGGVQETLVWTRPAGPRLRLMLKPKEAADLPAGLAAIDWQIDRSAEALLEPEEGARLVGWEAVAAFLRGRWQGQAGRVVVQINASTLAVEMDYPEALETLMAHLQQTPRLAETEIGRNPHIEVQVFEGSLNLWASAILYPSLFADANLEAAVRQALGRPDRPVTLQEAASLTRLDARLRGIHSLAGIKHLTALQVLDLTRTRIVDVSPLAGLTGLTNLSLNDTRIVDVGPLAALTALGLRDNRIVDVGPLAALTGLTHLDLRYNQIVDVGPLAALTALTHLDLRYNQIVDVGPLAALTALTSLYLRDNRIVDVGPLAGLTALTELGLRNNQVGDVSPLATLINLHKLGLNHNRIVDVSPLATLTGLTYLNLWDNQVVDVSPLATLTGLTHLYLGYNQVVDVSPLATLTGLTHLYLGYNQVVDVSPLAALTGLTYLNLSRNQVVDASPLAALTDLTELDLSGNPLSDQARNEQIPALEARGVLIAY